MSGRLPDLGKLSREIFRDLREENALTGAETGADSLELRLLRREPSRLDFPPLPPPPPPVEDASEESTEGSVALAGRVFVGSRHLKGKENGKITFMTWPNSS